ncbi:heat shock protein Hsp-12.2-like [Gigantopelta aegis]|uniref:heat shock protein Hsp-12.2-like n=1 Tax=Gigantopelta aegis TaxID=1735272 RepID=UPI001B88B081|nr:heat shock protein Hsp-12.2-like [Gigantopelta aegis]
MEHIMAVDFDDTLHFFDDLFDDMYRETVRTQNDMRNAMLRLNPPALTSSGSKAYNKHLQSIQDCVQDEDGKKTVKYQVDMSTFKPEEITVKTKDKTLSIHAKHEDKSENSTMSHEVFRQFTLPNDVDPKALKSTLTNDGILVIKGPISADNALEEPPAKKPALEEK